MYFCIINYYIIARLARSSAESEPTKRRVGCDDVILEETVFEEFVGGQVTFLFPRLNIFGF